MKSCKRSCTVSAKAAEIRLKAQGVNLDTLRFGAGNNSFVIVCNHAISRIAKSAIDTLEHLAGGVENIGSALATDGIGGFELVSMRDTFANRTTPLAMATLLDRMKPYSYFIYDIPSDICEKDYLYEALGNHTIDFSYLLACRQEQGRRVLNVFAEKRNREGSVAIFMEGEASVSEKEMQQKAGARQMSQEKMPKSCTFAGTFYDSRNICNNKASAAFQIHHAQIRIQCRKVIIGNLRTRICYPG